MASTELTLPRPVPQQKFRPPKKNLPQTPEERNKVLLTVRRYVAQYNPVPPQPVEELKVHADRIIQENHYDPICRDYIGVLVNNEMWRESLAAVPYERRLLLLPKCLRVESRCPAPFDEFGLLCKSCGLCSIQDLQTEAERLGYAVLVAEGSAIVMSLIQTGKIEAIIGVSCISVLERAFPYMEAAAIPGVAIPLLQDDCIDTTVDLDWIWDYINLSSDDQTRRMDLGALREEVDFWFSPSTLDIAMGPVDGRTETISRSCLMRAGKRWRPFLTASTFQALQEEPGGELPKDIRKVGLAVECFHKASLIHDDIEDNDPQRYGEKALHEEHGVPVAMNVGDMLIGEGYRLLASSNVSAEQRALMLKIAAEGQRRLCQGQGAELCWAQQPEPLSTIKVLDIFRHKTAPAFEVALQLGTIYAGLEEYEAVREALSSYSEALGIAYQIRDDLSDLGASGDTDDIAGLRPSVLLAIAYEKSQDGEKALLEKLWRRGTETPDSDEVEVLYQKLGAVKRAEGLLESYKEEAIRSLRGLENASLKGLLRRVIGKIFNDTEIKGWCGEFEEKNLRREDIPAPMPRLEERLASTAS
ncbi:MAG: All-trans-nonaprenyl-diphosphate synthase (geranyl-diphosphate specific) [Verrucomicrobia subdivision 3 bacterium]|nr:All-trans-nonaprenyl-diphosphate synthase (geranyl-diphosphate specific) [Limisphaerales bacterium]MCS1415409.1 All-trans-nonaprenyl-diphosphate synthase (geranyl-diphosphate specific) [Limisphaerales bacterium]